MYDFLKSLKKYGRITLNIFTSFDWYQDANNNTRYEKTIIPSPSHHP